jgi:hypothetical protein
LPDYQHISYKEQDLISQIKRDFSEHVLRVKQQFFGRFEKIPLAYQVISMDSPVQDEKEMKSISFSLFLFFFFLIKFLWFFRYQQCCQAGFDGFDNVKYKN